MVAMRDGVQLAADVYRLDYAGPLPALLLRTPYNKTDYEAMCGWPSRFARREYAVVVQDCRGCHASQGDVDFLWPEAEDSYDTVAWVAAQPWCDGRVATFGTSWGGWTQTAGAALGAPALAAMVPNMSGACAWAHTVRHAGALELRFLAWAFWHSAMNTQRELKPEPWIDQALNLGAPSFRQWLSAMPLRRGHTQLALVPSYERWALELLTSSDWNDRWAHPSVNPIGYVDDWPDVPILLVGGWYDSYTRSTFELFTALTATGRTGPVRALVGPWVHGQATVEQPWAGDVDFGPEAALDDFAKLHLEFYDEHLRGIDRGDGPPAPLRIFVMGGGPGDRSSAGRLRHGGQWRDEYEWPLARTIYTPYHLHPDGGLRPEPPAVAAAATSYLFNPNDPVPSVGGNVSSLTELVALPAGIGDSAYAGLAERLGDVLTAGPFDQRTHPGLFGCTPPYLPLAARADVVVFQTEPLADAVEVTGPVTVRLWVATTARDTDVTAKLLDVYPPSPWHPYGYAMNLTDSIVRLRYRSGRHAAAYEPGAVVEVEIVLYPTSNLFAAGHRIRLDISSSNFPRFDVNPGTGEPLGTERARVTAENTIYHDAAHPSHVVLPVVPPT